MEPTPSDPSALPHHPRFTSSVGNQESAAEIDSSELFHNRNEVTIRHGDKVYRLRLTKSGKLILHK